jgi:hypothetical protein
MAVLADPDAVERQEHRERMNKLRGDIADDFRPRVKRL